MCRLATVLLAKLTGGCTWKGRVFSQPSAQQNWPRLRPIQISWFHLSEFSNLICCYWECVFSMTGMEMPLWCDFSDLPESLDPFLSKAQNWKNMLLFAFSFSDYGLRQGSSTTCSFKSSWAMLFHDEIPFEEDVEEFLPFRYSPFI